MYGISTADFESDGTSSNELLAMAVIQGMAWGHCLIIGVGNGTNSQAADNNSLMALATSSSEGG